MVKKDQVKKIEKGDAMIKFWYTLKNLDFVIFLIVDHMHTFNP